jgi:hypothetical protein
MKNKEVIMLKMDDKIMALEPGDIFFTRGTGLLSKCIRFCTRMVGEKRTRINHVGIVVSKGSIFSARTVEALSKVKMHSIWGEYSPPKKDMLAIYRPLGFTQDEIEKIVDAAKKQVGKRYGYIKLVVHFLDWLCFGVYAFRRLVPGDKYPICSWLVAHSFSVVSANFGVDPGKAEPDDIWDFITHYWGSRFKTIRPLERL